MPYIRLYTGDALKQQWELDDQPLTIGRAEDNDITLPDSGVSKYHARIERRGRHYVVIDQVSANGVYVNGTKVTERTLKFWDEVQIFNHQLKFMASAKLAGEEDGPPGHPDNTEQERTMAVDIQNLGDLAALKQRLTRAYLTPADSPDHNPKYMVDREPFCVGRANDCKLAAGGWFAPRVAAWVEPREDGSYLIPHKRGKVRINDTRVTEPTALQDNDKVVIRGIELRYFRRTVFKA